MIDHPHADLVYARVSRCLNLTRDTREELQSAGFLGLAQAEAEYDPTRGVPFIPYATNMISWRIVDHIRKECGRSKRGIIQCVCGQLLKAGIMESCPNCGFDPRIITDNEEKVWKAIADGLSNKAIAGRLHLGLHIVNDCIRSLRIKRGSDMAIDPTCMGHGRVMLARAYDAAHKDAKQ